MNGLSLPLYVKSKIITTKIQRLDEVPEEKVINLSQMRYHVESVIIQIY